MSNLIDLKKKYLIKNLYYLDNNFLDTHGTNLIQNILKFIKIKFKKALIIQHNNKIKGNNFYKNIDFETVSAEEFINISGSYDLIISNFALGVEFKKDPNKYLSHVYKLLDSNGLFITNILNDLSFKTLKKTLFEIDEVLFEGAYLRFGPFNSATDMIEILNSNKFSEIIATNDSLEANYSELKKLRLDLKNLGITNTITNNAKFSRQLLIKLDSIFKNLSRNEMYMPLEFEITSISSWK